MTLKDKITTVMAFIVFFGTTVNEVLAAQSGAGINWLNFAAGVAVAVIGWFTGRENK